MTRGKRLFDLGLRRRERAGEEMREELEFHKEQRIAHLVSRGWSLEDARAEATRRQGLATPESPQALTQSARHKETIMIAREWFSDFRSDVSYALAGLMRQRTFAAIAILTIAFGIGANTAIYSAVDAILLRALPFPEPGRLMDIVQTSPDDGESPWSYPKYRFYAENQRSFRSVALHSESQVTLGGAEPERIAIEEVTAAYLSTLGVNVAHGSDFPSDLDAAAGGAQRVALIGEALWRRVFNADPAVVGQTVVLNNSPWEVAGILPPGFKGLSGRAEALVNLSARDAEALAESWSLEFAMIGRLNSEASPGMAAREAEQLGPRIYEAFPMGEGMLTTSGRPQAWTATARPLDTIRTSASLKRSLLVLFAAVFLVLLIACVNLANLLVARALARRREVAVRLALGAGRGRLVRLLLAESFTLAALGGVASLAIAFAGVRFISAFNPRESLRVQGLEGGIGVAGFETVQLDGRAFVFTLVVTLLVGAVFGLVPALRATRHDVVADLKDAGRGGGASAAARVSRRALVVAEVALAVVLLAGSGLMIRSLSNLLNVDPGFDGRNVMTLQLNIPSGTFAPDSMPGFYDQLRENVAAIPGVEHVALADCPPLNFGCNGTIMTFPDRPQSATGNAMVGVHWVTPNWFAAMRVPLKSGRGFSETDRLGTPRVVLINEAAARQYFPGENPIGRKVAVYQGGFDQGAEVIGVVGDVKFGTIDSLARPDAYISYGQARISRMMLFVRTTGDPLALAGSIRQVVRRVAPTAPIYNVRTMESRVSSAGSQARFSAMVLGLFAVVALTLAVMGIYGVMSFAVTQRRGEIGLRMALGAQRSTVLSLVMRETLWLALIGLVLGLIAAFASTRVLRTMLFDVSTTDPLTYVGMTGLLIGAACLAGWIPARRAASTDPAMVLREQ